jgi:(E)-4-hydroxy-3-methylbut-2-enyl-diphosphate synthase
MKNHSFKIGNLNIGNGELVIQSMTNTSNSNIVATTDQCIRLINAGAHMIRISVRNLYDITKLRSVKQRLRKLGFKTPLVADIHYNPHLAEEAARIVEKVRINPGNYLDRKKGKKNWTSAEWENELKNIKKSISKLVEVCKEEGTAIRIGVNHGSLSQRILSRYGNTPEGMVESAMEFLICFTELGFHKLVVSLKAANVVIMLQANQLMYRKMEKMNRKYPLHLGVTEAGNDEDGRIKSSVGIGLLLSKNIGSSIRVSLTEEPEFEIPVARKILEAAKSNVLAKDIDFIKFRGSKRYRILNIGGGQKPVVIDSHPNQNADYTIKNSYLASSDDMITRMMNLTQTIKNTNEIFYYIHNLQENTKDSIHLLSAHKNIILILEKTPETSLNEIHEFLEKMEKQEIRNPVVLKINSEEKDKEKWLVASSIISAYFLLANKIDGLWLHHPLYSSTELAFGILQATRKRITKTEYIACPSCGRTQFNLQDKLKEVKARTSSYKGLKIAVMGCEVNGIGEMADADYGLVGAGNAKVNLYKGQDLLLRNIDESMATEKLVELIERYSP